MPFSATQQAALPNDLQRAREASLVDTSADDQLHCSGFDRDLVIHPAERQLLGRDTQDHAGGLLQLALDPGGPDELLRRPAEGLHALLPHHLRSVA